MEITDVARGGNCGLRAVSGLATGELVAQEFGAAPSNPS
jgi:hypothetical protein